MKTIPSIRPAPTGINVYAMPMFNALQRILVESSPEAEATEAELRRQLLAINRIVTEALRDVLRYCVTVKGMPDKDKGRTDEQQAAYDKARAAIAKAAPKLSQ